MNDLRADRARWATCAKWVLIALLTLIVGWLATGPNGVSNGQPCYRNWLRVSALATEQKHIQDLPLVLLRHAVAPASGPLTTRVYLAPDQANSGAVRDVTQLEWRVWSPGQGAAGLQNALEAELQGSVRVEPLCEPLGAPELGLPLAIVLLAAGLGLALSRTLRPQRV